MTEDQAVAALAEAEDRYARAKTYPNAVAVQQAKRVREEFIKARRARFTSIPGGATAAGETPFTGYAASGNVIRLAK